MTAVLTGEWAADRLFDGMGSNIVMWTGTVGCAISL